MAPGARITGVALALLAALWAPGALAQADPAFRCGGRVEQDVWQLWEGSVRDYVGGEILGNRLRKTGDTYALYDTQVYLQTLASMAARCGRQARLEELARLIEPAFDDLGDLPGAAPKTAVAWVCRGGRICSGNPRLLNHEVVLNSAQFLALSMRVASGLDAGAGTQPLPPFVERALKVTVDHLQRWMRDPDLLRLDERRRATAAAIRDGSSRLFFTDDDLWMIDLFAEVAGVLKARPVLRAALPERALEGPSRDGLQGLLALMKARTSLQPVRRPVAGETLGADLDRGFWRLHADNRYAGYAAAARPAECGTGTAPARESVKADAVPIVDTLGWDFSHARRLVHALDALERHRGALRDVFALADDLLPTATLPKAFATQLAGTVWNGDRARPLFANFWDGTNGWYRVAYAGGAGCREGYPPYGLSDSFTNGGFVAWGRHVPVLGELGENLYRLAESKDAGAAAFIEQHYPGLGPKASAAVRRLNQVSFWPSLVQWSNPS